MASAFVVRLPDSFPHSALFGGANTMVVWADSATAAREVAASHFDGDSNTAWTDTSTTATAIVATTALTVADLTARVTVTSPALAVVANVTATGATVDAIGDALVTALNATAINGAAYVAGTNTLTVADAGDGIGDHTVTFKVYRTADTDAEAIASFAAASITHEGAGGDALTVVLPADNAAIPTAGWSNYGINILVTNPTTYAIVANVTAEGAATTAATLENLANDLVTALNATAINAASFDATTNILTVAAIADGIGDHVVNAKVYRKSDARKQAIPHLIGTVTDEGVAAAALTIQLATDALNVPLVYTTAKG